MRVQDILTAPSRWAQCHEALDESGSECSATDPKACRFSLTGALQLARFTGNSHRGSEFIWNLVRDYTLQHSNLFPEDWENIPGRKFGEVRKLIQKLDI